MRSKILFIAIVGFWVTMNYLLWRSQWGAHSQIGSSLPPEVVWEKILTAPDTSSLDIYDHDKKIGLCHWIATVGNSPLTSNKILEDDYAPDDANEHVTGYSLTFEGNATMSETNRIRFEATLNLSTNQTWKDLHVRVSMRPHLWDIRASTVTEKLAVRVEDKTDVWQKTFSFSDLRDADALWNSVGESPVLGLLTGTGLAASKESLSRLAGSIQWQAHEDWMQFGHSKARVYRLETVILGRRIYVFTSRIGEILWVEFPNKLTFRNGAFEHF